MANTFNMGSNKKRLNEESEEYKVKRARNNEVINQRFPEEFS